MMPRYAFRIEYNGSPFNGWNGNPICHLYKGRSRPASRA